MSSERKAASRQKQSGNKLPHSKFAATLKKAKERLVR